MSPTATNRNMKNIIEVKNLTKRFNRFTAVDDISFKVEKGEIFAFLGPNGAGKSTVIKMLITLLESTAGKILLNGCNPIKDKDEIRKSFGIVFQESTLDEDMTAIENMQFHAVLYKVPKNIREKRIEELLKFVELWDRRNNFVKIFSGGMKRRLELARGLLHHPIILFLDEPTLGLDPQTRNRVWTYIQNINKNEKTTVFFTTHYMEEAEKVANKIAVIDRGKIIANGTLDQLKAQTKTTSLEEAFLFLTGTAIRDDVISRIDPVRTIKKIFRRRI